MMSRWLRTRTARARSMGRGGAGVLLGAAALLGAPRAEAQRLQFTHLGTEGGLSAAWVTHILRDSRGFMWFSTRSGLDRYDGYVITAFRRQRGDSTSLVDNFLEFMMEDRDSVLWVGTRRGVSRFDRMRNTFTNIVVGPTGRPGLSMLQLRSGLRVIGTDSSLFAIDPVTLKTTPYFPAANAAFAGKNVASMTEDRRGHIWIGTTGAGLVELDPATGATRTYIGTPGSTKGFPGNDVRDIVEDGSGALWTGVYGGGVVRLDPISGAITRYQHDPKNSQTLTLNAVLTVALNGTDGLWIGLDNGGIDRLDFKTSVVTHNAFDADDALGLNSGSVWALTEDKTGTLWAGTFSGGVNIAKRNSDGIRAYHSVPGDGSSLSMNSVLGFAEDSAGAIWVATDGGGLNRFDPATRKFTRFTTANGGVNSDAVLAVTAEPGGALWIGTWAGGISRVDPHTHSYTAYTTKNSNIPSNNIFAMHLDRDGRLWVGSWQDGLLLFDRTTKSFTVYPINTTPGLQSQVWIIQELHDGRLALGTLQQGVRIFDPRTRTMTAYHADVNDRNSLASDEIRAIHEGTPGILWIGTGEGLDRLDLATNRFTHFGADDGILATAVSGIAIEDNADIWLSTDQGVTRFDPRTKKGSQFTIADGLQNRDFTPRASLQTTSGTLFFGGNNGFNVINPAVITRNLHEPPVVITGFRLFNKPVVIGAPGSPLSRDISETKEITLSYLQSVFTFEFAALDYTAPTKNQYAYMLEGFDQTWTQSGAQHSVTYTGLPAGHYTFRVKGSNNDGIWNDAGASIRLTITPPFWRTWWFRTLIALLVVVCLAYIALSSRQRHRHLKGMNARLAHASEHDREAQQYLESNVLDILAAMQKFSEGDYSVALYVASDDAIGNLRRGFNSVVADLKRAEEELRQSQKMEAVGRLAGGVAHDFNNLLTVIVCNTALALEEADAASQVAEELKEIERAAVRASALTRQLLAFSRKQILQPRLFSLNEVAKDLGHMLARTLGEDIDLQVVTEPQLALVRADPGQIERVLMNLVMNARDAMPRGGAMLIQTRNVDAQEASTHPESESGAYVEMLVRDAGTGMSAEVKRRIFEPFFTTKEQGQGTGLGLATVYGIVKQSGGYVRVESEAGAGTTFCIYLPQMLAVEEAAQPAKSERPPRGSATVLLVEDEMAVRTLASRVLTRGGYKVLAADSGAAAIAIAKAYEGEIDLLVTDVVMPGMSGRELAERLVPTRIGMRVLFASGYTEDAILRHGVTSEAVSFLAKPFTPDELIRKVQFALESPVLSEPAEVS
jgi:signal transduction histidine kinase/ligand-binding sensor domain-containing protein/ActR/RegA family two-component response regulator